MKFSLIIWYINYCKSI